MRKVFFRVLLGSLFVFVLVRMISMGPGTRVIAQTAYPDPTNEHGCPSQTGAGGGAEAIPAFVGTGSDGFSPNQSLCLPQLAPVPSGASPLVFLSGLPGVTSHHTRSRRNRFNASRLAAR